MKSELKDKLPKSTAAKATLLELEVASTFRRNGWTAFHSPRYDDVDEGKLREADVVSFRKYKEPARSGYGLQTVRELYTTVECKLLSGTQILAAPPPIYQQRSRARSASVWQVLREKDFSQLSSMIHTRVAPEFSPQLIEMLLEELSEEVLREQEVSHPSSWLSLPAVTPKATSYTITKGSKPTPTGALWDAIRQVQDVSTSILDGFRSEYLKHFDPHMLRAGRPASIQRPPSNGRLRTWLKDLLRSTVMASGGRSISVHQVVVTDALIYQMQVSPEEEDGCVVIDVGYFRLHLLNISRNVLESVDIVHVDSLNKYVEFITRHYEAQSQREKLVRLS
jgi:hypothetical protein